MVSLEVFDVREQLHYFALYYGFSMRLSTRRSGDIFWKMPFGMVL
jgi:hypothetical protein